MNWIDKMKEKYSESNTHNSITTHEDICYLLSIIEQAEKAFNDIAQLDINHGRDVKYTMTLSNIVGQALQTINGNKGSDNCIHDYALIPPNEIITSHYRMCKKCHDIKWEG